MNYPNQYRPLFDKGYKSGQVSEKDDTKPSSFFWMKALWQIRGYT
jgi:hypothetical protein